MAVQAPSKNSIQRRILAHLLHRLNVTRALDEPFSHIYLEEVLPRDLYAELLQRLPHPELYSRASEKYGDGEGNFVRLQCALTPASIAKLAPASREFWGSIAAALTAPELKEAVYAKLAKDLMFRYGVSEAEAPKLAGYARPTLYREVEGFEIPPHPDTRKKVVTMHLYLPADRNQLELGTALYRRRLLAWPMGAWQRRFEKVKQFPFAPNSGYAFVVNNAVTKKSWHGREKLPPGAGVRNTLLNTFYEEPRAGFGGH